MTNTWTVSGKAIELWRPANALTLTATLGVFTLIGISATLTYASPGGSSGQPMGLLLALTYP
jgi:hypothetical protein